MNDRKPKQKLQRGPRTNKLRGVSRAYSVGAGETRQTLCLTVGDEEFHLTECERAFAEAYLDIVLQRGFNSQAAAAAMRRIRRDVNSSLGYEYLKKPEVSRYVGYLRNTLSHQFVVDQGRIIKEIEAIAFANMADYVRAIEVTDPDGRARTEFMVDLEGLDAVQMSAIAECRVDTVDNGPDRAPTRRVTIKLHDKQAALDKLVRIRGLYQDRTNILVSPEDIDNAIAKLQSRVLELGGDGVYVPTNDDKQIEVAQRATEAS